MPKFQTKHRVRHSPRNMFDLVADVEQYPHFVPLCESLRVRSRDDREDGSTVLVADMTVSYKMFRETFTSRVELHPDDMAINVTYLDGPFSELDNRWRFLPIEGQSDACSVYFYVSYAFRSRALAMLMGAVFDRAFRKFATAFEQRADALYA